MPPLHLILGCVVALWEVAINFSVMKEIVVHQVPSPALIITAQKSYVTLALHGGPFGGNANHSHGAQGSLPPNLPGMSALGKTDLSAGAVSALGDGVPMKSESVLLDVHVPRAVMGAKSVLQRFQLKQMKRTLTNIDYTKLHLQTSLAVID